jgi:chitinase
MTAESDSGGNFADLADLKRASPNLRLLISLGGWTGSGRFSDAALTSARREAFARSALDVFIRRQPGLFDGIDVDWEFPVAGGMKGNIERPDDKHNFTLLLAELRRQLDMQEKQIGRHLELTIAASARPAEIANVEIAQITPLLDFINVMTYDYHSGSSIAHFNAPLFAAHSDPTPDLTTDVSMRAFLAAGVPPNKLLVGIPFYGRVYGRVPNFNAGMFQVSRGTPEGWEENTVDWSVISHRLLPGPRYVRHWESSARVPWLYDSTSGDWITYDDPQSVSEKARYVLEHRLGGVVVWELGGDDGALMDAITMTLRQNGIGTH